VETFDLVMATTHTDRHGLRLTKENLEEAAASMASKYIPLLNEHDWLEPLGRIYGATVRERSDGEWELYAQGEILAPGDEIPVRDGVNFSSARHCEAAVSVVVGDEFLRTAASKHVLREITRVLGHEPELEPRRALEPPDLIKVFLAAAAGTAFKSFVEAAGTDAYRQLKSLIQQLYATRPQSKSREFCIDLWFEREGVAVLLIQKNPSPERVDAMLSQGLCELDELLPALFRDLPGIRKVVAEYGPDGVHIAYVLGADCLPIGVKCSAIPDEPEA
jgi:hypothetical protein